MGLILGLLWVPSAAARAQAAGQRKTPGGAEGPGASGHRVAGVVVDADGRPVGHASVVAVGSYWSAEADLGGRFRIELPDGIWRLRARHLGFADDTVRVKVPRPPDAEPLRIVLRQDPVQMKGLSVDVGAGRPMATTITRQTVRQAPALGEPDVFRAVALLPEASQADDLSGRIHLAGGPSDETGVRLDGHPLLEPFHLLGLEGAFNVAALDRAHVATAWLGSPAEDRLSGAIEMESRSVRDRPDTEGVLSLLSASATATRPDLPGGVDLLASARATWADRVVPLLDSGAPRLGYEDLLARTGRSWGEGWRAEALGYATRATFRSGHVGDLRVRSPLTSGEHLLGVRLLRTTGRWRLRARVGWDRATVDFEEGPPAPAFADLDMDWVSGAARVERRWRSGSLRAGVSLDRRRTALSALDGTRIWHVSMPDSLALEQQVTAAGAWAEASRRLGGGVTAVAGARLLRLAGRSYLAPRTRLSVRLSGSVDVSASLVRRYQYDAHVTDPPEGTVTPPRFLLRRPRRADIAALWADWRPDGESSSGPAVRLTGFFKRYRDQTRFVAPDSADRPQPPGSFPVFQRVPGRSYGASARLRLPLGRRGLLQASYTYERALEVLGGRAFDRDFELTHRLTVFASVPVGGAWTVNGALRVHSGHVFTPVEGVSLTPLGGPEAGSPVAVRRLVFGRRNSGRLAPYTRLDLSARHPFGWLGARWTFFAQVLNVTFSRNPREPDFDHLLDPGLPESVRAPSLPLVPSLGLEVSW